VANKAKITTVKKAFHSDLSSSVTLFAAIKPFTDKSKTYDAIQGWEPLHHAQAMRVVALAFMNIVAAWEEFVQSTFIRYMAGATSGNGYRPKLRVGPCSSLRHAGQILTRRTDFDFESDFISWSSWGEVTNRAALFFEEGRPFSSIVERDKQRLKDAVTIRNRVAHASGKSRAEFIKVAKLHLGLQLRSKLRQGYTVGQLLLEQPRTFGPSGANSYFEAYVEFFTRLSDILAP
jgi:hypothetical protein